MKAFRRHKHHLSRLSSAQAHLRDVELPVVVKPVACRRQRRDHLLDAQEAKLPCARSWLTGLGEAGDEVVIEDCLQGEEVSLLVLRRQDRRAHAAARDYKRVATATGPNTALALCASPYCRQLASEIVERVLQPTLEGCENEHALRGCAHAGLMLTQDGPRVLDSTAALAIRDAIAVPLLEATWSNHAACIEGRSSRRRCAGAAIMRSGVLAQKAIPFLSKRQRNHRPRTSGSHKRCLSRWNQKADGKLVSTGARFGGHDHRAYAAQARAQTTRPSSRFTLKDALSRDIAQ